MLLFLVGADIQTSVIILIVMILFGLLIFRVSKRIFRKTLKGASDRTINIISRVCAFLLSPLIIVGILALVVYSYIEF